MTAIANVTGLDGDTNRRVSFRAVASPPNLSEFPSQFFSRTLKQGWNMFGIPYDISTIEYGHNSASGYSSTDIVASNGQYDLKDFIKNHIYENQEDTVPLYYKSATDFINNIYLVKNYLGQAFFPEFDFSNIGNYNNYHGYEIKCAKELHLKIQGKLILSSTSQRVIPIDVPVGWYIMPFLNIQKQSPEHYFEELLGQNKLIICKDKLGNTFLPESNFNGIGDFIPGEAYQIKTS